MLLFRIYRFPLKVFALFSLFVFLQLMFVTLLLWMYHITQVFFALGNANCENVHFFFHSIVTRSFGAYFIVLTGFETTCFTRLWICFLFLFSSNSIYSPCCVDGEAHCEWQWLHTHIHTFQLNSRKHFSKIANSFWFQIRLFMCLTYFCYMPHTHPSMLLLFRVSLNKMEKFINYSVYNAINFSHFTNVCTIFT